MYRLTSAPTPGYSPKLVSLSDPPLSSKPKNASKFKVVLEPIPSSYDTPGANKLALKSPSSTCLPFCAKREKENIRIAERRVIFFMILVGLVLFGMYIKHQTSLIKNRFC